MVRQNSTAFSHDYTKEKGWEMGWIGHVLRVKIKCSMGSNEVESLRQYICERM
jgi:hypothetical protein